MWVCIVGIFYKILDFFSSLCSCACFPKKLHFSCCDLDINNRSNENISYHEKISK